MKIRLVYWKVAKKDIVVKIGLITFIISLLLASFLYRHHGILYRLGH